MASSTVILSAININQEVKHINDEKKDVNVPGCLLVPLLELRLNAINNRLWSLQKTKIPILQSNASPQELLNTFQILENGLNDSSIQLTKDEILVMEEYKLAIMTKVELELQQYVTKKEEEKKKENNSRWRWGLFAAVMFLDLIPMAVGGFVGMTSVLTTIPEISDAAIYIISLAVTGIETLLAYSVMGPLLKDAFGITQQGNVSSLLEIYNKKAKTAEKINSILTNEFEAAEKINASEYTAYAALSKRFNTDVGKTKIEKFQEPLYKKVIRFGLSGLNVALNIAGGYFMATSLLTAVSAGLIGTPVGWGIISLVVIGGLVGRFAIRSNTMFDFLNPNARKYQEVEKTLSSFKSRNHEIDRVLRNKIEERATLQKKLSRSGMRNNTHLSSKAGLGIFEAQENPVNSESEVNIESDLDEPLNSVSIPTMRRFSI